MKPIAVSQWKRFSILPLALAAALAPDARAEAESAADAPAYPLPTIERIALEPDSLQLSHGRDARRVAVLGQTADGEWIDVTQHAVYSAGSGAVSVDDDGFVVPEQSGAADVTVTVGEASATLPVTVDTVNTRPVSFTLDVMPLLTKLSCNAGACHGSANGKNGFKLSLRGYDPDYDYQSLIRDISGRRFNKVKPGESLMLMKPAQEVPHEGGRLIEPGSREYNLIRQWIAEGARMDPERVERVPVLRVRHHAPVMEKPGQTQQFVVTAVYPDGSSRDVTRDAVFSSSAPDTAAVDETGMVTALRRGEASILIRYEGAFSTHPVIVMGDRGGFEWKETPEHNYIDALVYQKLRKMKIRPADLCTDEDFIRRAYLDIAGIPPGPGQVKAFLAGPGEQREKRNRLIEELLASDGYVEHWTNKLADLLQCNRKFLGERGVWIYRMWIRDSIAQNKPYDQFTRELLLARGSSYQSPPSNFYLVNRDPDTAVENITQVFLGVRFQCAKCHDHPFEKWTQEQYYQLGAFFGGVDVKPGTMPGEEIVYAKLDDPSVYHPKTNKPVPAAVPYGEAPERESLRRGFAEWLASKDNELFVKSTVNRFWSYFLGRGIIEPVDDIRNSNPPSNPELLDALADEFVKSGFDLKHLIRTICQSRVYQHSIETNRWNEDDGINFSRALPRRLTAEQMFDAISVAAGSAPDFGEVPEGFRACQLPDNQGEQNPFLKLFGKPERESACECERTSELSLSHAMNLINGPTVSDALIDPEGRVAQLAGRGAAPDEMAEELYLAALSRHPTADEKTRAAKYIADSNTAKEGAQDLLWALINSPAFLFNR